LSIQAFYIPSALLLRCERSSHSQNETVTIKVAHDYNCPWCWIGIKQMERLEAELGVKFELLGYELMPEELPWGDPAPRPDPDPRRPVTPSRMQLAYAASGMEAPPKVQPSKMRTHNALLATEYAKSVGVEMEFAKRLYEAYWLEGVVINDVDEFTRLAEGIIPDIEALRKSVESGEFESKIVKFDDEAYAAGVFNVPTFFIGGEKYAEQPYSVLAAAIRKEMNQ
jgi:predicted DsbA family dithiol-disulfide isomerase